MRRRVLVGAVVLGVLAVVAFIIRRRSSGYEGDEIDAGGQGATFGQRDGTAPEQKWAPAETRTGVTVEQLSMASRMAVSGHAIREVYPTVSQEEIEGVEGDLQRLARMIAERTGQPQEQVTRRLDGILAQETPRSSYPAH